MADVYTACKVCQSNTPCDGEEGPGGSKEQVQKQRKSVTAWEREHSVHGAGLGVEAAKFQNRPELWQWMFIIMGRSPGNEIF